MKRTPLSNTVKTQISGVKSAFLSQRTTPCAEVESLSKASVFRLGINHGDESDYFSFLRHFFAAFHRS